MKFIVYSKFYSFCDLITPILLWRKYVNNGKRKFKCELIYKFKYFVKKYMFFFYLIYSILDMRICGIYAINKNCEFQLYFWNIIVFIGIWFLMYEGKKKEKEHTILSQTPIWNCGGVYLMICLLNIRE